MTMSGNIMRFEFRLFGPRKGQTMVLNGHQFVDGICILTQASDNMGTAARVFSFYGAYARGTQEYDAALAAEEAENGAVEVDPPSVEGPDPAVPASAGPDGAGPSEGAADASIADVGSGGTDPSSAGTSGDGHEHAGVPQFPEDADYRAEEPPSTVDVDIKAAVMKLDPEIDGHWVMTGAHKGKPKLQAVEDAYGKAGLTRQDIEAATPGWNRDAALEAALAA
jgi:hypothetical protein